MKGKTVFLPILAHAWLLPPHLHPPPHLLAPPRPLRCKLRVEVRRTQTAKNRQVKKKAVVRMREEVQALLA